jgi:16S rRNA (guanine527-N7)-methyltransferase
VSVRGIPAVLAARAANAGLSIPEPLALQLTAFYQVLSHWNRKINLTSLSDPGEAVDRLLLEPVAAAAYLPSGGTIADLGSGGGSPAVPLALALGSPRLVMVESRVRKAAFLREVLRELGLHGSVEVARFEDVALRGDLAGQFDVVSVRAIRLDGELFRSVEALLRTGGLAALFGGSDSESPAGVPPSLRFVHTYQLIPASRSALTLLQRA